MPAANNGRNGEEIVRKRAARLPRLTAGAECVQDRREQGHGTKTDNEAGQHHEHKTAACNVPRGSCSAGAYAARDHDAHADGQADQRRGLEKANDAGEANRRGDLPLAKQGDVEQVQQIDGEHGDEADRPSPGHDHNVMHDIAGNEVCLTGCWHVWHR